jgi:phosphomannomutase
MGAGYNRMNDLVIMQTTQGIARYLVNQLGPQAKSKGVVIGYDHRKLGSLSSLGFARMSAAILLSEGFKVYCLEGFVPTPFVAFAVSHLTCAAGFMVTASHNPKEDNGFKVYWGNGAQIIPPHDSGMAEAILSNLAPWQSQYNLEGVLEHANYENVTDRIADAYYSAIGRLCRRREQNGKSSLGVVYTAMHGVGYQWVLRSFALFGHCLLSVPSQSEPDPEFPTVRFPNPEEKGVSTRTIILIV